jgi:PAS domain S-box-containing protein
VEPQVAERRSVPLITAISALFGSGLLFVAVVFAALREPGDQSWQGAFIAALAGGAVILVVLLASEVIHRRRSERAFERASGVLERLGHPFDEALDELAFPDLLDELARRASTSLQSGWAAVLLSDPASGELRVAAATPSSPRVIDTAVDPIIVAAGAGSDRRIAPLESESGPFGLLEIGEQTQSYEDRDEVALTRLVADRVAVVIERARLADAERRSRLGAMRARSHLALIADVSISLARAIEDVGPAMREIASGLVEDFADLCTIHLAGSAGRIEQLAGTIREAPASPIVNLPDELPGMPAALQRVMSSGRSQLTFVVGEEVHGVDDELGRSLRDRGMTSWVIAPIRVRGLPVGTIMAATTPHLRGFRPSDQAVIDELSNRIAIAVERALLYSEMREATTASERRAEQLARLIEAAIALNPSSTPGDLLKTLVDQATQVLQAPHAHAWLHGDDGFEAELGSRPSTPIRSGSPLVDSSGGDAGYLAVTRPETEQFTAGDDAVLTLLARLASAAVQNARLYGDVRVREQRLQALFEASPLAILELDVGGGIRDVNPAALGLFGSDEDDERIHLPPVLKECLAEMTAKALAGEVAESEIATTADGERIEMWISTAPVRGHDSMPTGVLAVISDVTERKRLEEQLTEAHRYEAIANLAGGVAHDFNNLLTIILGYSDLLLQTMSADSAELEDVTAIHQAGQHAAVITNQLLTLSRNQVVQPIVVPIRSTCESLLPMLRRLAGDQVNVQMACHVEASIRIDAGQLEQVLFNLVLNSRDAMPGGGDVMITAEAAPGSGADPDVALTVSDTGSGMDEETLARCREPFFTTKGRRGIGLGLATVATIVQRAGGHLDIESTIGEGTSISAVFPVVPSAPSRALPTRERRAARVLLVDDDELVRGYAFKALTDAGYEVTSVDDAEEALRAAGADGGFDLIVSDVVLPGMNGLDLVRTFGERWPATARLLMTGFAGTDTTGTDLEDVQVLKKPFAVDELARAADDALKQFDG